MQLHTATPTAVDYASRPTLVSPGYLWPVKNYANDRRVLTLSGPDAVSRQYVVAPIEQHNGDTHIHLRAADDDPTVVGNARLVVEAVGGVLSDLLLVGDDVQLLLVGSSCTDFSSYYAGGVRGNMHLPFARCGNGVLTVKNSMTPRNLPLREGSASLKSMWWLDKCVCPAALALSEEAMKELERINTDHLYMECPDCYFVPRERLGQAMKHVCAIKSPFSPGTPRPKAKPEVESAGGTTETSTQEEAAGGRTGTGTQAPTVSIDHVSMVGVAGSCAHGFVLSSIHDTTFTASHGGCGVPTYVRYDSESRGASYCASDVCRLTRLCQTNRSCKHIDAMKEYLNRRPHIIGSTYGVSMDGFLAFVLKGTLMEQRQCNACVIASPASDPQPPVAATFSEPQRPGAVGVKTTDSQAPMGRHDGDSSDESDDSTEATAFLDTKEQDLGAPTYEEIMTANIFQLRRLSNQYGLDDNAKKNVLKYNLVDEVHNYMLTAAVARLKIVVIGDGKRRKKKKGRRKLGGLKVGRPDAFTAPINAAEEAVECIHGRLCRSYEKQRADALVLMAQFKDHLNDAAKTADASNADASTGNASSSAAMLTDVKQRVAITRGQIDLVLSSIQEAAARGAKPVILISTSSNGTSYFSVYRPSVTTSYSSPGFYSMVTLLPSSEEDGETSLHFRCKCSAFRHAHVGMGGKSKLGGSKMCLCIAIVALTRLVTQYSPATPSLKAAFQVKEAGLECVSCEAPRKHRLPEPAERRIEERVHADLDSNLRFPDTWSAEAVLSRFQRRNELESCAMLGAPIQHSNEGLLSDAFPNVLTPTPISAPLCPHGCTCADGSAAPLKPVRDVERSRKAWVFVGNVISRRFVQDWQCRAACTTTMPISIDGVRWSMQTGLFNVCGAWFFSVDLLDKISNMVWRLGTPIEPACSVLLEESFNFMQQLSPGTELPNRPTASEKMFAAWKAYELVLKEESPDYADCAICGKLPVVIGLDVDAKFACNLSRDTARKYVDYNRNVFPSPENPLWTQERLLRHCNQHILRHAKQGYDNKISPIPVYLVPPFFPTGATRSDTLFNTEYVKKRSTLSSGTTEVEGLQDEGAGNTEDGLRVANDGAGHTGLTPDTSCLDLLATQIYNGLNIHDLRSGGYGRKGELDKILSACGLSTSDLNKFSSDAQKVQWILQGADSLQAGESHCHMFVSSVRGSGGAAVASCIHTHVYVNKVIFHQETNRDHHDILNSLPTWPPITLIDDSCGLATFHRGNDPDGAAQTLGPNRGCPKAWNSAPPGLVLDPVAIPELLPGAERDLAMENPTIDGKSVRDYAEEVLAARGCKRYRPHPFMQKHLWRLILSDRFHHGIMKKTHKKPTCFQRVIAQCSSLSDVRTSFMESVNARMNRRLKTVCTVDPATYFPLMQRMHYQNNKKIHFRMLETLTKKMKTGHVLVRDPIFNYFIYACARCKKFGHLEAECTVPGDVECTVPPPPPQPVYASVMAKTASADVKTQCLELEELHMDGFLRNGQETLADYFAGRPSELTLITAQYGGEVAGFVVYSKVRSRTLTCTHMYSCAYCMAYAYMYSYVLICTHRKRRKRLSTSCTSAAIGVGRA